MRFRNKRGMRTQQRLQYSRIPRRTIHALVIGASLAVIGAVSGCSTGSVEDDNFFNRGWLKPKELDGPEPRSPQVEDSMPQIPD